MKTETSHIQLINRIESTEHQGGAYNLDVLTTVAKGHSIHLFPSSMSKAEQTVQLASDQARFGKLGSLTGSIKASQDCSIRLAGAFYATSIKPLLATGRDAYKPTAEDVEDFCQNLAHSGADYVFYYALSKTRSPARTGSPDIKIDFAELEMLKHLSGVVHEAELLGFDFRVILIDETPIISPDSYFGFTKEDTEVNISIAQDYLKQTKVENRFKIRSIIDSVVKPLGSDFEALYQPAFDHAQESIRKQISESSVTPETARLVVFLDCMPNEGIEAMGYDASCIRTLQENLFEPKDLVRLPTRLLEYIIGLTTHAKAIMDLRESARERVLENGNIHAYPEYASNRKLYGGVTRSTKRWSFLPHPTRYQGRTINPMHGLAIYDNDEKKYQGVVPFKELLTLTNNSRAQIIYLEDKPVFSLSIT